MYVCLYYIKSLDLYESEINNSSYQGGIRDSQKWADDWDNRKENNYYISFISNMSLLSSLLQNRSCHGHR